MNHDLAIMESRLLGPDPKFPKQESAISEGTGVVLVGAEGTTPSAYPIHISRIGLDQELKIGVFSKSELQLIDEYFDDVHEIMDLGYTKWKMSD